MKRKVLAVLSIIYIYIYTIATSNNAWALNDATSFSPEKVQVQAQSIGVPVGTVIVWTKEQIPDGWLECNGQKVNKTLYPDLAVLMSNTPNYKGMFLRGAGSQTVTHGSYGSVNHGTTLGQVQGDSIRNITGSNNSPVFFPFANGHSQGAFTEYHNGTGWVIRYALGDTGINSGIQFNASLVVPTANENRPVNVGVKYIIKAE